jgi:hypothetical protein
MLCIFCATDTKKQIHRQHIALAFNYPALPHVSPILCSHLQGVSVLTDIYRAAGGGAVGFGIALQAGRSRVRFPIVLLELFIDHNPSGRNVALGSTLSLIEMSTRNIFRGVRTASA